MTRGIDLNINFKVKAEEFLSHSVTVCEICYAVAIAEHHLMAISREFAMAQSIPVKMQNVAIDITRGKDQSVPKPVVSVQPLHRWRFLFYFSDIAPGMRIIVREVAEPALILKDDYYLQYRIFDSTTKFPIA